MKKKIMLFVLLIAFIIFPKEVLGVGNPSIGVSLYKCDPSSAANLSVGANQCRTKFLNGQLVDSLVNAGGTIDPGTKYMAVITLDIDTNKAITGFQTMLNLDSKVFKPIMNGSNNLKLSARTTDFPTFEDWENTDEEGNPTVATQWVQQSSVNGAQYSYLIADDNTVRMPLTKNVTFAYIFIESLDTASPGSATSLNLIQDETFGTESGKVIDVAVNSGNYVVAGSSSGPSNDASLKDLTIIGNGTNYPLDPVFVPNSVTPNSFDALVPNSVSSINLSAIANDSAQSVSISLNGSSVTGSNYNINVGNNTISIAVMSEAGTIETYSVNVYRLSNDVSLKSISFTNGINSPALVNGTYSYDIQNVSASVNSTLVNAVPNNSNASILSGNKSWNLPNSGVSANKIEVVVNAEDCKSEYVSITGNSCSSQKYTFNVFKLTSALSTNNDLSSLKVDGVSVPNFNASTLEYTLSSVDNSKTSINISATLADSKATIVSGTGSKALTVGENSFDVVVQAENKDKKTYTIKVKRNDSVTSADDPKITISLYKCDPTTAANLSAGANQCRTKFENGTLDGFAISKGGDIEPGTKYMAVLTMEIGSNKAITGFQTQFNMDTSVFKPIMNGTNNLKLAAKNTAFPTFEDWENTDDDGNPTVSTQWVQQSNVYNGTQYSYLIADDNTVRMPLTKNVSFAYIFIESLDSAVAGSTPYLNVEQDETFGTESGKVINVLATRNEYKISGESKSTDATLSTLSVTGNRIDYPLNPTFVPGSETPNDFKVVIPNNINSVSIGATANDEKVQSMSISLGGTTSSDSTFNVNVGNNIFSVIVTSEEGTPAIYTINVYRLNNVATLSGISFTNGVSINGFNSATKTYTINDVPYATKSVDITPTLSDSNAVIKGGSGVWNLSNHGTTVNKRDIQVEAENCKTEYNSVPGNSCSTETYTINLYRVAPSSNKDLSSLTVDGVSVPNFSAGTITYTLSNALNNKTSINIAGTVADTGKAIIESGTGSKSLAVGDNSFPIVVKAEDGTTKTYTINVRRLNNVATLSSLTINSTPMGTLSPGFSSNFFDYYTYSYAASVTSINISATVTDTANATVGLTDTTSGATPITGTGSTASATYGATTKSVVAFVTAEDGTTNTYSIKLTRAQSSNNNLSALTVTDGGSVTYPLSPTFNAGTKSYNVTVNPDVSQVVITATPEDTLYGTIKSGAGTHTLNYGNNDIEVVVEAENKSTSSYFIHINRKQSNDAKLATLTVDGVSVPGFSPSTDTYTLSKVSFSKTSVVIGATTADANARIISGTGNKSLSTGLNTLQVVVEAQDGTPKTYTIKIERAQNQDASVQSVVVKGVRASLNDGKYEVTLPNSVAVLNPEDVVINVSSDASVSKVPNAINLSTKNVNNYDFTVTAEDTSIVLPYRILITREKSNDASIGTVTLTLDSSEVRTCTMSGTSCKIEVPVNTTGFNLSASIHAEASINPINGTHHDMGASESNKAITLTVTAEDGTPKTYTVNVERLKSSDNDLSDLTIDGTTVTGFSPDKQLYNGISVPGLTSSVTIGAVVNDVGKATIVTDLSQPFALNFGLNQIDVVVRAENNQTKTYTLNITREKGIDATLSDLTVDGTTVTGFNPTKEDYTLDSVDYNTVAKNIGATPNDPLATVSGTGASIALSTGDNVIKVTVTAHDGITQKEYRIHVNRALNTDTSIKGITVAGIAATHGTGNNYTVTVPNNVTVADISNVVVEVNDPKLPTDALATYSLLSTNLSTKVTNNVAITVTSEAGNTDTYVVAVTREKSKVATLDTLTVTDGSFSPSFSKDKFTYTVTVPVTATGFDVNATKTDNESTINSGTGHYNLNQSTMTVPVVVVSEDGSVTNTYTLNVKRTESSVNTLDSLTVSNGTNTYSFDKNFAPEDTRYIVNVPGDIDNVDIAATLTDTRATIESGLGNHTLNVGDNPIIVRVRSESGSPLDYTIIVKRAKKTDAKLTDLQVDGATVPGFDPDILSYTITSPYPNNKTSVSVSATKSDADATLSGDIISKNLVTGPNQIVVTVTAQDGVTTNTYTVNVTREFSSDNKLAVLSVSGTTLTPSFDPDTRAYEVTVPETKAELRPSDITAIPNDNTATVAMTSGNLTLSTTADNYYVITVTAENGQSDTYVIKVIRPKSTDATLKDVRLNGASISPVFNPNTLEYTLSVPYGATSFDIEGIPNVSTTQVSGNNTYTVQDTTEVQIVTLAEAGMPNTKTYKFNVVEAPSNDATLANLAVLGYPFKDANGNVIFNSAVTTYDLGNIPYGVSEAIVNAVPTNASSTIEYFVGVNKQASNRVTIPQVVGSNSITVKVTAPDGISYKDYIISYNIVFSDNAYLSELRSSVGSIPFNKTTYGYELNVSNDVNSVDFDITTEDANARITVNGTTFATPKKITVPNLPVGNTTLSVLVTAQNGTAQKTYNVVIKKAAPVASSDATLKSLEVVDYPFATTFDPIEEEYTIGTIPYSLGSLTINAVPNVGASKITYLVNGTPQVNNVINVPKVNGPGEIVVQVIAEDGVTVKNYKIAYSKTASNNAYLSNLTVTEGTLTFNKTTQDYVVNVGADINSVSITATAEDSNATIKVSENSHTSPHTETLSPLSTGDNKIIFEVIAEDGTTKLTYIVNFVKAGSGDDTPDKITSTNYGHSIDDDYIRTVMIDTTAGVLKNDQLDNDAQYLEVWTADDSAQVQDGDKLGTGMIIKLIINGEEKDRKVIVVIGDTSGDGLITMLDANIVVGHFTGVNLMTGAVLIAGDTNFDDNITMLDANIIVGHYTKVNPMTSPIGRS